MQQGISENWVHFSWLREQVRHVILIMGSNKLSEICYKIQGDGERGGTIDEIRLSISWSLWKQGYQCVRVYSVYMSICLKFFP